MSAKQHNQGTVTKGSDMQEKIKQIITRIQDIYPNMSDDVAFDYIMRTKQHMKQQGRKAKFPADAISFIMQEGKDRVFIQAGIRKLAGTQRQIYITRSFSFIYIHTVSIISEERKHPDQECSICLDDMYNTDVIALECNHRFHKKCINDWFREKHDCPQCRNYSLPKDDFPSLLSGGR